MSDVNDSVYVFIYGTLRAGEINDMALAAQRHGLPVPQWVGAATVPGTLYDFGDYPGWVPQPQAGAPVAGDIYRIAPALVAVLDEIEEVYPGEAGLFARITLPVAFAGVTYKCIAYPVQAASAKGFPIIEGGDWVAYRQARAVS
jgi:gamma-glutamylcyclotransferase (GGCT)/AIG2-like uncharacterized protein YtfP